MANALADEARSMTDAELGEAINEAYREVFNVQFQRGTRQLQNPMALRAARRQVARLRTILREREIAAAAGTPIEPLARVADAEPEAEEPEAAEDTTETAPESAESADSTDSADSADSAGSAETSEEPADADTSNTVEADAASEEE